MATQPHKPRRRPTPEEIRASLRADHSPRALRAALPVEDLDAFDRQYREALHKAVDDLDLDSAQVRRDVVAARGAQG